MASPKTRFLNTFRRLLRNRPAENVLIRMNRSEGWIGKLGRKLTPGNELYQPNTRRPAERNGMRFNLNVSDYIEHYSYFGFYDNEFESLMALGQGKKSVFDIGSNIGFVALNLSAQLAEGGKLYAFEPDPTNFSSLQANVALNPEAPVIIENKGLGNEEGQLKLVVDTPENRGGNRIVKDAQSDFTLVDITTLDLYCSRNSIETIDMIKIDVEGFEMNVLKGGQQMISTHKPELFIEINDVHLRLQHNSAEEVIRFLEQYYSKIYDAGTNEPVDSTQDFSNRHFDVIARN